MHIRCEQCGARYELDLPSGTADGPARRFKFRCSACGESFVVLTGGGLDSEDTEEESPIRPATGAPASRGMLLKQEGKIYHIADLATLQRWVVERRVLRDDLLGSVDGGWLPVGEHPDLAPFFQVVEKAEHPVVAHEGAPLRTEDDAGELLAAAQQAVKAGAGDTWGGDDESLGALPPLDFGTEVGGVGSVIEFDQRIDSTDDPTDAVPRPDAPPASSVLEIAVDDLDDDWEDPPRRSIANPFVVGALVLLVGAGGWWLGTQRGGAPAQPATSVAAVPPAELPPAEQQQAEAPQAQPATADVAETLEQEPPPQAPPAEPEPPKPVVQAPPPVASAQSLARKGWKAVDGGRLDQAQDYFERAVNKTYGTGNAHFGLGYLAEKHGRIDDAQRSYCTARQYVGRDVDLEREIAGRLRVIGRVCP